MATLMWNNSEHLEAYLAIPSMGAVLHTLNLRLDPATIGYIATHAGDDVVIADRTLVPLLAQVLPHATAIRHVLITGLSAGSSRLRYGALTQPVGPKVTSMPLFSSTITKTCPTGGSASCAPSSRLRTCAAKGASSR